MNLTLPFDTDDRQFIRGVQIGLLWQRLQSGERPVEATIYEDNAEMVLRVAEATGVPFRGEVLSDGWMSVTFGGES